MPRRGLVRGVIHRYRPRTACGVRCGKVGSTETVPHMPLFGRILSIGFYCILFSRPIFGVSHGLDPERQSQQVLGAWHATCIPHRAITATVTALALTSHFVYPIEGAQAVSLIKSIELKRSTDTENITCELCSKRHL